MKLHLLILGMLQISTILSGQGNYRFSYRQELRSQPSGYTKEIRDTEIDQNKCGLTMQIFDRNGNVIPFANIEIKSRVTDTILHSDTNGFATSKINAGISSVNITALQYTPLSIDSLPIRENTKTTINATLGKSNALRIAVIYSLRKLSEKEIQKITEDLSNDNEENELIKNKTCYIIWEI